MNLKSVGVAIQHRKIDENYESNNEFDRRAIFYLICFTKDASSILLFNRKNQVGKKNVFALYTIMRIIGKKQSATITSTH